MSSFDRIEGVYAAAKEIPFDNSSRIVLMSDCHRGTGSGADNFSKNQNLYYVALTRYLRENYTYIELGDGDELWENKHFPDIAVEYEHVFDLLAQLYRQGRFHMLYGNHDAVKRKPKWVYRNLSQYSGSLNCKACSLFPDIKIHEGLILRHRDSGHKLFLIHGHQADFFNDRMWRLSKTLVRYLWRPLELVGVQDPFSSSKNQRRTDGVEEKLTQWCLRRNHILLAGHTHQPRFPAIGEPPYFNDGSCVHRRSITAIEIVEGALSMVKWSVQPRPDGTLFVNKEIVEGPVPIGDYYLYEKPKVIA